MTTDLEQAKKILADRRAKHERERERRLNDVLQSPDTAQLLQEWGIVKFETAKNEVMGTQNEILTQRKAELQRILQEKNLWNVAEGIREKDCLHCADTGYVEGKRCECLEQLRVDVSLDRNPILRNVPDSLKAIDYGYYGDSAMRYADYGKNLYKGVVNGDTAYCTVLGAVGTGKTFLAAVAVRELLKKGRSVRVVNAVELNKQFLEYHCAPLERKLSLWPYGGYDVLFIDDLGVEMLYNNVSLTYLYELLTERRDKKTIITTNLDLRGLENKYGQRIFSRLADKSCACAVLFEGRDLRLMGN